MKLHSEVTGILENPSLQDIKKSFDDPEFGDVAAIYFN